MNTKNFRERELKFRLIGSTEQVEALCLRLSRYTESLDKILSTTTIDHYYEAPGKAQFLRLRSSWGKRHDGTKIKLKELTVKQKDLGCNQDRLEVNSHVTSLDLMRRTLSLVLGKPSVIRKKDWVAFLRDGSVLSISQVNDGRWYLEVEAPSMALARRYSYLCVNNAKHLDITMLQELRSLYEIYVRHEQSSTRGAR